MDAETLLKNLLRIGTVTAADSAKRLARVKFRDSGVVSDWLYVLASRPYIPDYSGPQQTEAKAGGGGAAAYESHAHDLTIKPWMPRVNATVLCLYMPIFCGDGFILGEIGPLGSLLQ